MYVYMNVLSRMQYECRETDSILCYGAAEVALLLLERRPQSQNTKMVYETEKKNGHGSQRGPMKPRAVLLVKISSKLLLSSSHQSLMMETEISSETQKSKFALTRLRGDYCIMVALKASHHTQLERSFADVTIISFRICFCNINFIEIIITGASLLNICFRSVIIAPLAKSGGDAQLYIVMATHLWD
jgi:hypothetical protein